MTFDIPSPFKWDASFDVKNHQINEQHQKLFDLIDALDHHRTSASHLKDLLDLVVLHFKTEEDGFAAKHWDGAAAHKVIHDKFVADALAIKTIGDGEIHFMKNWLVNHIKGSDMQYSSLLHD